VNSLQLAGLELLSGVGCTYNVLDGQRGLGDPQAVTDTIRAQLTMGSFVTGAFTDNRTIKLQVLIQAPDRLSLSAADSALRAVVNSTTPQVLQWIPEGGYPLLFDTFRGQVDTEWSGKLEGALARRVTVTMLALPFGRSDVQRSIAGSASTVQLLNTSSSLPTYYVPASSSGPPYYPVSIPPTFAQVSAVPMTTVGTAYSPVTSPAPVEGTGAMRIDFTPFPSDHGLGDTEWGAAKLGETGLSLVMTGMETVTLDVYNVTSDKRVYEAFLTLTDHLGASQTFTALCPSFTGWQTATFDISATTLDLSSITGWSLFLISVGFGGAGQTTNVANQTGTWYICMLRAFPSSSTSASTTHGAVFKLANVLGDAQAPASIAADRGGTNTIGGFLLYKAPAGTPATTPSLLGLTGSAPSTGTTSAPSTFNDTYRVFLANGGGSNIAAGGTLTITQKVNGTTVATATLTTATVAGGSKWADCGDITLPLIDIPAEASAITYGFSFSATATDVILASTHGALAFVPVLSTAKPYVWADEATAFGAGEVYAGSSADRSDATALLGLTGAIMSGAFSVDPGDNYLLAYCIDGAFSNVTVTYSDRYLGERTAA